MGKICHGVLLKNGTNMPLILVGCYDALRELKEYIDAA